MKIKLAIIYHIFIDLVLKILAKQRFTTNWQDATCDFFLQHASVSYNNTKTLQINIGKNIPNLIGEVVKPEDGERHVSHE